MEACTNMGATWTSASAVWTPPANGWMGGAGFSFATTHIDGGNGNSEYTCYDIDINDHEATCINGPTHDGYTIHGNAVGYNSGCAATWTDTYYTNCANIAGCPAQTCGGDAVAVADTPHAYCCEDSDCSGAWHYCGCQRDFEAGGKVESACDVAAGCIYTAAPVMETAATVNPGDTLGCSNVYTPMLGACRGLDPTTGAQVGVNAKGSKGCDIDGKKKACGDTGQPICEMTQAECEAGCAAENAIAPGRCEAYHWAPGGWCTIHGPHVHKGIGWNVTTGAAAAISCWRFWPADVTEVTGTNTNTLYMCYMLKDKTVNNVCASLSSGTDSDDDSDDESLVVILCVVIGALLVVIAIFVVIAILVMMKRRKPTKPLSEAAPPVREPTAPIKAEALGMMSEEPVAEAITIPQGHVSGAEAFAMATREPPPQPSEGWGRRFASLRAVEEPPPPPAAEAYAPEAEFEPEC